MVASIFDVRVLHFAASDRQHCFLRKFFGDALSNKVCVDTTVDGAAVLFVRGASRFFFSFALLFGQTGSFCLFLAAALRGYGFFFFAASTRFRFLLLASCTLFRFDALAFSQLCTCFLFSFTARCGFNLRFVLRFGISAGPFSCFPSNIFLTFQSSFFFRFFTKALKLCSFMRSRGEEQKRVMNASACSKSPLISCSPSIR